MKPLKPKTCRVCKTKFEPRTSTQVVCCTACAYQKVSADKARKEAKARREGLERIKTKAMWMKEAQAAVNAYVRERDKGLPCISCGRHHAGQYHAGHYRTTKAAPELRFDEFNVNAQCAPCNNHLSGNIVEYRRGLLAKYGLMVVEYLEGPHEAARYTIDDLQAIKKKYAARARELAKDGL